MRSQVLRRGAEPDNIGNIPTEYPPYFEVNLNFNKYSPQWFFRE